MTLPVKKDEDSHYVPENAISLKHFPPKLRKLGKYLLKSDKNMTVTEACKEIGIDRGTALTEIWRAKKKGNDFYKFIEDTSDSMLNMELMAVDTALLEGAVSGSHNHQKLYYQRIGKLQDVQANTATFLTIGINISGVSNQDDRDKGVIDVTPFIPSK